jgi:hypothetical protein
MSHFTVLVVGEDVDEALLPFDENSDTDQPKWDWYQVGGRWAGMLKLKPGAAGSMGERSWANEGEVIAEDMVDSARAGDIDWDSMLAENADEYRELYRKVHPLLQGRTVEPWDTFYNRANAGLITMDEAREQYHGQELLKLVTEAVSTQDAFFFDGAALVAEVRAAKDEDDFVRYKGMKGACTYALLVDGEWHEPGEMGWFGMSGKTPDSDRAYTEKYWEIVRGLPADATVTVVDCHI